MKSVLPCALVVSLALGNKNAAKTITIGTPGVSFHQVANWVVVRAMERLGYNVTVMDQQPHRLEYPKFTDPDGPIDIFTGSDLPWNHAPWLWNHTDEFAVVGTVNEATDILLGAPSYAAVGSVSEFVQQKERFPKVIYTVDLNHCPQCVFMSQKLADTIGFGVAQRAPEEFILIAREKMASKTPFVVSWYVPCWLVGELPGIATLRGDLAPFNHHNAGKTLIRRDRMGKLDSVALSVLSSVFVGNDGITLMDAAVNKQGLTPAVAADQWIANNSVLFESFFTKLPQPNLQFV
jgi:glycine betaine/proline transport system substrate-binding protein